MGSIKLWILLATLTLEDLALAQSPLNEPVTDPSIPRPSPSSAAPATTTETPLGESLNPEVSGFIDASNLDPEMEELRKEQAADAEEMKTAGSKTVRRFHEVLEELLAELAYDVKSGQISGLKNLAIRRMTLSDTLPRSYGDYLELLVQEKIRENSRIRLIACLPCKTKTSRIVDGKLLISSPQTNMQEMNRAAELLGIDYFMDVVLVYHTTHMVLALQVFNSQSKEMVWARTYNSETIKTRFQKLAIDYSQMGIGQISTEYKPEYRIYVGLGIANLPNVAGTTQDKGFLNLHFRATEKFDNRHSEFGLQSNIFIKSASLLSKYPTEQDTPTTDSGTENVKPEATKSTNTTLKPYSFALTILGVYSYNFIGSIESYNDIRKSLSIGLGGIFASGYLAGIGRLGADLYFGRRFALGLGGFFIMPSQVLVDSELKDVKGGPGGELVFAIHF